MVEKPKKGSFIPAILALVALACVGIFFAKETGIPTPSGVSGVPAPSIDASHFIPETNGVMFSVCVAKPGDAATFASEHASHFMRLAGDFGKKLGEETSKISSVFSEFGNISFAVSMKDDGNPGAYFAFSCKHPEILKELPKSEHMKKSSLLFSPFTKSDAISDAYEPYFAVANPDSEMVFYFGAVKGTSVVIGASDKKLLDDMAEASKDPKKQYVPRRLGKSASFVHLRVPVEELMKIAEGFEPKDAFIAEAEFVKDGKSFGVDLVTNACDLLMTADERKGFDPMRISDVKFHGEGKVVASVSFRPAMLLGKNFNEGIGKVFGGNTAERIRSFLRSLKEVGVTEENASEFMNSVVSVVLGGKSPIIPGKMHPNGAFGAMLFNQAGDAMISDGIKSIDEWTALLPGLYVTTTSGGFGSSGAEIVGGIADAYENMFQFDLSNPKERKAWDCFLPGKFMGVANMVASTAPGKSYFGFADPKSFDGNLKFNAKEREGSFFFAEIDPNAIIVLAREWIDRFATSRTPTAFAVSTVLDSAKRVFSGVDRIVFSVPELDKVTLRFVFE